MDSTLLAGIIGALATIAGAFITRGFVVLKVSNPTHKIDSFTTTLLHFFSKFSINNARVYVIKRGSSICDDFTYVNLFELKTRNLFKNLQSGSEDVDN